MTLLAVLFVIAQTSANPTGVAFVPSSDHATNVTAYELALWRSPVPGEDPAQVLTLGKPTPDTSGDIRVLFSTLPALTIPTGEYTAAVYAKNAAGLSTPAASAPFAWTATVQTCTGLVRALVGTIAGDVGGEWVDLRVLNRCGNEVHREPVRMPRVSCTGVPTGVATFKSDEATAEWYELTVANKCKVVVHRKVVRVAKDLP